MIWFYKPPKWLEYAEAKWVNDSVDQRCLHSGMLHKTKESAKMHSNALMALSYGSANWEQES